MPHHEHSANVTRVWRCLPGVIATNPFVMASGSIIALPVQAVLLLSWGHDGCSDACLRSIQHIVMLRPVQAPLCLKHGASTAIDKPKHGSQPEDLFIMAHDTSMKGSHMCLQEEHVHLQNPNSTYQDKSNLPDLSIAPFASCPLKVVRAVSWNRWAGS